MIKIELDEEEKALLIQMVEDCLSDLRTEISNTDNFSYKLMLKKRKTVLMRLMDALQVDQESFAATQH